MGAAFNEKNIPLEGEKKLGIRQMVKTLMSGFEGIYPSINLCVERNNAVHPVSEFLYNEHGVQWRSPEGLIEASQWPSWVRSTLFDVFNLPTSKDLRVYISTYPNMERVEIKVRY